MMQDMLTPGAKEVFKIIILTIIQTKSILFLITKLIIACKKRVTFCRKIAKIHLYTNYIISIFNVYRYNVKF
jgi:hypothetical protein